MPLNIQSMLSTAQALVHYYDHQFMTTDHLAHAFMTCDVATSDDGEEMFKEMGIDRAKFVKALEAALASDLFPKLIGANSKRYTFAVETFIRNVDVMSMQASINSDNEGKKPVGLSFELLLVELFSVADSVSAHLLKEMFDMDADDISVWLEEQAADAMPEVTDEDFRRKVGEIFNGPSEKDGKGCLEKYCDDLTAMAKDGRFSKLIGRESEIFEITQVLARKNKNNVIIVGEPGVGKTQIVEGLALGIVNGTVPETLKGKKVLSLNIGAMVAGAKFRGDFEQRANDVINALTDEHILFIDEMHTVIGAGAGSDSNLDFANILKPKLSRSDMRVIGATTYEEYQTKITKDPALVRRFMRLDIKEPNLEETRAIVEGVKATFEEHHGVKFSKDALDAIMQMSEKYIHTRRFPDKAIDLLDSAGARNKIALEPKKILTQDDIAVEVARAANIPLEALLVSDGDKMKDLAKTLGARVFGQEEAVEKLTISVHIARAGLRGKNTTQGGYLFVGPSGVGKTEIAKTLAETLCCELVRFDMSEFSEQHSISKLIGSPPGYVGHSDGNGKLIDELDKHPDCILLLDEVEKAHPDIFNLFLQALDEGTLSSSTNKTVSLRNVTIIMTTNLGSRDLKTQGIGFSTEKQADGIDKAVKAFFRPEFLNRLDSIVKFNDLTDSVRADIAKKFIKELNDDVKIKGVKISLKPQAIKWLIAKGTEPGMGARPMKRIIHEHIKKPLAAEMLFGKLVDGGKVVFDIKAAEDGDIKKADLVMVE